MPSIGWCGEPPYHSLGGMKSWPVPLLLSHMEAAQAESPDLPSRFTQGLLRQFTQDYPSRKSLSCLSLLIDPEGIRTPVAAVKGLCPGPLDDGATRSGLGPERTAMIEAARREVKVSRTWPSSAVAKHREANP